MTTLPDTNTILRYLIADEPEQYSTSRIFFENVRKGKQHAYILESVLVECVYVLTKFYEIPQETASEKLQGILHYKGIKNSDTEELIYALKLFAEKNIDIVDCILSVKAQNYGYELFTFDKRLLKLHKK